MNLRRAFVLGLASSLACACSAPASSEAETDDAVGRLAEKTSIGPICSMSYDLALEHRGVTYVAFCPNGATGTIARLDLVTGKTLDLATYAADETVAFQTAGESFVSWTSGAARTPFLVARAPTTVGIWDATLVPAKAHTFVAEDLLTTNSYVGVGDPWLGMVGYVGKGKVLAAWDRIHPKLAIVDVAAGAVKWQSDAPTLASSSSFWSLDGKRSADGSRWFFTSYNGRAPTFVDVAGTPRIVPLVQDLRPTALYTWGGDYAPWDGQRLFVRRSKSPSELEYALIDLDNFVQSPLGSTAQWDDLKATYRPASALDGTLAYYTYTGTRAAPQYRLSTLAPGATQPTLTRDVPATMEGLAYVAPGGSWVIATESIVQKNTDSRLTRGWLVDMQSNAAPVQLFESYDPKVYEDAGVVTLVYASKVSQHSTLRHVLADRTVGAEIDVAGYAAPLSADKALVGGCVSTVTDTTVTPDPTACLAAPDQRIAVEALTPGIAHRFVVRRSAQGAPRFSVQLAVFDY